MSKKAKAWLIAAASLVLVGCIVFGGAMAMFQWDFTKLSTVKYESNRYEIQDNYSHISIVTDTADIAFVSADDAGSSVVCYEQKNVKHTVMVEKDTLVIQIHDTRRWFEHIGFFFDKPKITLQIPGGTYGVLSVKSDTGDVRIPKEYHFERIDISESTGNVVSGASVTEAVKIKTSTGNICIENISAGQLDLSVVTGRVTLADAVCDGDVNVCVSTGKADLTNVRCRNLMSTGDTGNITLQNVTASESFSIERSTGDVRFDSCDADEIFVETDTGDVKGTLRTDKVFVTQTDTGRVDVPKTATGGKCEITTDTGNIKIEIR